MITVFGHRYHFQKKHWAFIIGLTDTLGTFLFSLLGKKREPEDVKKILVSRIGHLGDVLLATSVLPHLKKAYPEAKIDFLVGEWARVLLANNPYVNEIIIYNSFLHNRSGSLWHRVKADIASFLKALRKIRGEDYDLGIDLRSYFINSIPLLYFSGVKYTVGYGTGGFGFLLDKEVAYKTGTHEVLHVADLVRSIGIDIKDEEVHPLYKVPAAAEEQARRILKSEGINLKEPFLVISPGVGDKKKEWKIQNWKILTKRLKTHNIKIVFCGGPGVSRTIKTILSNSSQDGIIDLSGSISLEVFAGVVKRASLVVGLDSFPCHLAAALGIPTVVLWSGINEPEQWKPYGDDVRVIRKDVTCAPCYRSGGCEQMICMDISPEEVAEQVNLQLESNTS